MVVKEKTMESRLVEKTLLKKLQSAKITTNYFNLFRVEVEWIKGKYLILYQTAPIGNDHTLQEKIINKEENMEKQYTKIIETVKDIANKDITALDQAEKHYGNSWKKRGGIGAFMMLARKWDRIEKQVSALEYDIFHAIKTDKREEGIIDDIRDLRRYLLLVEAELSKGEMNEEDPELNLFKEDQCEWKVR
jgi:hypothetical protein